MELKLRLHIVNVRGASISYMYDTDDIRALGLDIADGEIFIEVSNIITYQGINYRVERFAFKLYDEEQPMNTGKGINAGAGVQHNYNCQLAVFVTSI